MDQLFFILLCVSLLLWGLTAFIPDRVLTVIAAVAAIVAGAYGLLKLL